MKRFILIIILSFTVLFSISQTEHIILPSTTDTACSSPNNNHFVYLNQSLTAKNKLFLFFPGTGGVPFNTRLLLKHAANLGYHSIGLNYPNIKAINELCINVADTTCHSRARLEVYDGIDRHDSLNVNPPNSIKNRTLKLLQYLATTYPSENWGQYYNGSTINWNKIIISGHSQGGGHAGIISKLNTVDRVVMFAATDWIQPLARYADWITWSSTTTSDKYYGFIHQQDEGIGLNLQQNTWTKYGMNAYGNIVFADTTTLPYNNTHQIYTNIPPANNPTKFHGCIVADAYMPMNGAISAFADIWTHLIDSQHSTSIQDVSNNKTPSIYPNPASNIINIKEVNLNEKYIICDLTGRSVQNGKLTNHLKLDDNLKSGIYYLIVYNIKTKNSYNHKFIKE
jgi:hypothetical protein